MKPVIPEKECICVSCRNDLVCEACEDFGHQVLQSPQQETEEWEEEIKDIVQGTWLGHYTFEESRAKIYALLQQQEKRLRDECANNHE